MRSSKAASFLRPPLIGASGGSSVDLIRRTVNDVNATSVCFPAGLAASEVLAGVCDPSIMLFFEFIDGRARIGIAAAPELLDEVLLLFQCCQALEDALLFIRDDVDGILVQPFLEVIFFLFGCLWALPLSRVRRPCGQ